MADKSVPGVTVIDVDLDAGMGDNVDAVSAAFFKRGGVAAGAHYTVSANGRLSKGVDEDVVLKDAGIVVGVLVEAKSRTPDQQAALDSLLDSIASRTPAAPEPAKVQAPISSTYNPVTPTATPAASVDEVK